MAKDELLFRPRRPGAHTTSQRNAPTATIPLLLVTPTLQPGLWLYSRPDTCFGPQMEMGIGVAGQGEKQNIFLTNALTFKYDKIESFKRNFWLTLISKLMTTIMFLKFLLYLPVISRSYFKSTIAMWIKNNFLPPKKACLLSWKGKQKCLCKYINYYYYYFSQVGNNEGKNKKYKYITPP